MTDQDVELSRREAAQAQEESNLNAELTRIMAGTTEYERKVKHLKAAVAEAQQQGVHDDGHLFERARQLHVPALDAESPFAEARQLRVQALAARERALHEVRQRITTFRGQIQQLNVTLGNDEKHVQRLVQQAKQAAQQKAAPPPPADDVGFAQTLVSQAPPPGLKAKAPTQPSQPQVKVPLGSIAPKRQAPRVRMQAQVDFESEDNFFNGFSANISDGGLFIATVNLLALGTHIDLAFSLPTGERVECKGVVRWVREVDDRAPEIFPGMGVQFVDLEPRAARAIEGFIQQREPMFYVE